MGIGAIYKELTFDGEQSGDYGLYITGAGTFNAPQRDVEMVTIPGRNGSFAHDRGRFENIEVTYPAGVYGSDESDFADKIADIRAWLCSKKGYVRLTDEYNPNEYRLAVYKSGLEVTPALLKAGEFDLVFECKPQRFLTSGETAQTIAASGDTLTNPTRFNARPMLEVNGYGKIGINNDELEIISGPIGNILLADGFGENRIWAASRQIFNIVPDGVIPRRNIYANVNTGDVVTVIGLKATFDLGYQISSLYDFSQTGDVFPGVTGEGTTAAVFQANTFTFTLGTAKTASATVRATYVIPESIVRDVYLTVTLSIDTDGVIILTLDTNGGSANSFAFWQSGIRAVSSKSALGEPIYLDLDIGEAWKVESGEVVSVNNSVSLGAELPELKPGANTITFDGTVSDLKVVPRWWTV